MKTIVVFSGGLDSTVLLFKMRSLGAEVRALSIDYGQRHVRELEAAADICNSYGFQHQIADLRSLTKLMAGSSQTDPNVPVPHGHYAEETMKATVVPNRNMVLLAVAGAWAISTKSDTISYAAHAGDHAIYPDCREEFVVPLSEALWNADWHHVKLERPFIKMTKADIVKVGWEISAPMHRTYSCYEGERIHCGKCGTCTERREAFKLAGVHDPTQYRG